MRTLEETVKDAQRWRGCALGSIERDALYYLERYSRLIERMENADGSIQSILEEIKYDSRYIVRWNNFVKRSFVTRDDAERYIDSLVNNYGYMRESLTIEEIVNDGK